MAAHGKMQPQDAVKKSLRKKAQRDDSNKGYQPTCESEDEESSNSTKFGIPQTNKEHSTSDTKGEEHDVSQCTRDGKQDSTKERADVSRMLYRKMKKAVLGTSSLNDSDSDSEDEDGPSGFRGDPKTFKHTISVDGAPKDVSIDVWFDRGLYDENPDWLDNLNVSITSTSGEDIGGGLARYVKRGMIRRSFWENLSGASEGLSELAFGLFDRFGCIKQEILSHPVRKGSGVWGNELSKGGILVIELVFIEDRFQRSGLGSLVVEKIIERINKKGGGGRAKNIFMWPIPPDPLDDREHITFTEHQRRKNRIISFARSLGFRRIGATGWFGYSVKAEHLSRHLSSNEDYDLPSIDDDMEDSLEDLLEDQKKQRNLHTARAIRRKARASIRYPLHYAASTMEDDTLVTYLDKTLNKKGFTDWLQEDTQWYSILHLIAEGALPKSLEWLLINLPSQTRQLLSRRTVSGYTPLEGLQSRLDRDRGSKMVGNRRFVCADEFEGFTKDEVMCLTFLQFGLDGMKKLEADAHLESRIAFGCTCGGCVLGISPRTKHSLVIQAEILYGMLGENLNMQQQLQIEFPEMDFNTDQDLSWYSEAPPCVYDQLKATPDLKLGFVQILVHIATLLRGNIPPNVQYFTELWEDDKDCFGRGARVYLEAGGTFGSAVLTVIKMAMDRDPLTGDGSMMMTFGEEREALPKCRNDSEYGMVARCCGLEMKMGR
ncbi:hypothetical protein BJ508DRAFT_322993 [Ascobolus immersus RN42]|uniref:Uncharacterized protein n=1 Tax=Ascobolus immersus RN42 TaxID=1160509 RepID=A0A3N4IG87_ASCIM|nr:hypothetical protein BJ508DRAFT_322993 [Ascobolus immersus RN42]